MVNGHNPLQLPHTEVTMACPDAPPLSAGVKPTAFVTGNTHCCLMNWSRA